jgi:protocatechuate 3,4-dioxygenase beta subunit
VFSPLPRLTRQQFLWRLLGLGAAGSLSALARWAVSLTRAVAAPTPAAPVPACVVRPEQTEGPFFVEEALNRSDVRRDPSDGSVKEGAPLRLTFAVSRMAGGRCSPLPGAVVHVWQCDALGVYSDVQDARVDTRGRKFLRGYQTTDPSGLARFTTIYPGWYQGRTVHIHFKIRVPAAAGRALEFTSQLCFDDGLTDQVHTRPPYAQKGPRPVRNAQDFIFRTGGDRLMLSVVRDGEGYAATFPIALVLN